MLNKHSKLSIEMDAGLIVNHKCHMIAHDEAFLVPDGMHHLRILQTTDLHAHVLPYDYMKARTRRGGLAAAAAVIATLRSQVDHSLLFDCGDFLQGSAMGDFPGLARQKNVPMIVGMNQLEYDAATLGNHDFSFGYRYLKGALDQADFPVVASNLILPPEADMDLPRGLMLQRVMEDGTQISIGVVGVAPPTTAHWEAASVCAPMRFDPVVDAARREAAQLRAQGADIVIALCHSGILAGGQHDPDNAATPLAALDDIDVVLAGHIHRLFPGAGWPDDGVVDGHHGALHGVPAVMAGAFGRHVGVIDLALTKDAGGAWRPAVAQSRLVPVGSDAAAMPELITQTHDLLRMTAERPIGTLSAPVNSFLSVLGGDSVGNLIGAALVRHGGAAIRDRGEVPVIAMVPPYRYGWTGPGAFVDVPAGPMAGRYAGLIYPYPNRLAILKVTGAILRLWLEQAVAQYAQIQPGAEDVPLLQGVGYALDMAYGLDYVVDLSRPGWSPDHPMTATGRIGALTYQGRPVTEDQEFYVASSAFRAAGVPPIPAPAMGVSVLAEGAPIRDLVMTEIAKGRGCAPPGGRIDFAPIDDASAIVLTAPQATGAIAEHPLADRLDTLGLDDKGLLRLRLRF